MALLFAAVFLFQSTHPTRECDLAQAGYSLRGIGISIHAPYKRVRRGEKHELFGGNNISIHAPYKRVRQTPSMRTLSGSKFQSTHPTRECDLLVILVLVRVILIFQSTHPTRECDIQVVSLRCLIVKFQSTHPTRECDSSATVA